MAEYHWVCLGWKNPYRGPPRSWLEWHPHFPNRKYIDSFRVHVPASYVSSKIMAYHLSIYYGMDLFWEMWRRSDWHPNPGLVCCRGNAIVWLINVIKRLSRGYEYSICMNHQDRTCSSKLPSLKLTFSPLNMNGWKMNNFPFVARPIRKKLILQPLVFNWYCWFSSEEQANRLRLVVFAHGFSFPRFPIDLRCFCLTGFPHIKTGFGCYPGHHFGLRKV